MKFIVICTLTFLFLTGTFALQSRQGKLEQKNEKVTKSHLQKALEAMIQLQAKVKTEGGEQKLFAALDLLKENINQKLDDENQSFSNDGEQYDRDVARVTGTLNQLQGEIEVLQGSLVDLNAQAQSLNDDLESQQAQLSTAQNGAQEEQTFLANLEAKFTTDFNDYQAAIDLLEQAINKLQEASGFQETAWSSFLETQTETFSGMASNLHQTLRKVKKQALYKPVIAFFSQLSTQEQAPDRSLIQRAQSALSELRNFYIAGQAALSEQNAETTQEHTELLSTLNNQVSKLENTVIPATLNGLNANKETVEAKQLALEVNQSDFDAYTENLQTLHDNWTSRQEMHELLVPEYQDELQIVFAAESLLGEAYAQNMAI